MNLFRRLRELTELLRRIIPQGAVRPLLATTTGLFF